MKIGTLRLGALAFLILVILGLSGSVAWLWVDEHGHWRELSWIPPKALPPELKVPDNPMQNSLMPGDPAQFVTILSRPLFAPDRRPPPPPPPPAAEPPPDPFANIKIYGIFSGANGGILARVDDKMKRIRIGETVGAWALKSTNGREVAFEQGDEKRSLSLSYTRLDTPTPQAIAANTPQPPPRPGNTSTASNAQDETRARLERRNALRASRGMPPVTE